MAQDTQNTQNTQNMQDTQETAERSRLDAVLTVVERVGNRIPHAAYRIGDSTTQLITPLNPYIIVLLGFARQYEPNLRFGALIARMAVFVPVFWIAWVLMLAVFYFTGADVGPGMPIHLSK